MFNAMRISTGGHVLFRLGCLLLWTKGTGGSTHWIVTEEGKIEAQTNSVFHMKHPYDLMALIEQERRVDELEYLRSQMVSHSRNLKLTKSMLKLDHMSQASFFDSDPDCQAAGQPLTEFDLFGSTMANPDSEVFGLDFILNVGQQRLVPVLEKPYCENSATSDVDLGSLENLSAMLRRKDLKISPEPRLSSAVLQGGRFHQDDYGHLVYDELVKNREDWILNLLAANYWRIAGNAPEAVNCVRRAIFFSPDAFKHLGLLTLANVFHRAHRSEDAVEVLSKSLELSPHNIIVHFTLGSVYATLMQFDKALDHYQLCLDQDPSLDVPRALLHAVICHLKIENSFDARKIKSTFDGLRKYRQQHERFTKVSKKLISEQATTEVKLSSRMSFEQLKIALSNDGRGQDCVHYESMGQVYLSCDIRKEIDQNKKYEIENIDEILDRRELDKLLRALEKKVESFAALSNDSSWEDDNNNNNIINDNESMNDDPHRPSLQPLYEKLYEGQSEILTRFQEEDPTLEDCAGILKDPPRWNEYPTVFLSPEHRGFDIKRMMSKDIGIPEEYPAALPWYPPICQPYDGFIVKYDKLLEKFNQLIATDKKPEKEIEADYDRHSPERSFHEWGARVTAALKINLAPKWIVYLLAGTYWRIRGHPENGVDCYRQSLARVPEKYKDVVLTNFAGILYKAGVVDEALVMTKDAYKIHSTDPYTNFFLANLYSVKGNISGALAHYSKALRFNPDFAFALQYACVPLCHMIYEYDVDHRLKKLTSERHMPEILQHLEMVMECKNGECRLVRNRDFGKTKIESPESPDETTLCGFDKCSTNDSNEPKEVPTIDTFTHHEHNKEEEEESGAFIGPIRLFDGPVPDVLLRVRERFATPAPTAAECADRKDVNWEAFTSTWLSVSAKGIDVREFVSDALVDYSVKLRPHCGDLADIPAVSLLTMDHLEGVKMRRFLHFASESGLKDALRTLTGEEGMTVENMGTKLAISMEKNPESWVLSTSSALYWRVKGNAEEAVNCLRHSLFYAPRDMSDIPLISLANIMHRAGLFNDALVLTNMALEISPKFVVIHFTMGNIYVSKGDFELANSFYLSTLALQFNFEPAKDRFLSLQCDQLLPKKPLNEGNKLM